MQQVFTHLFEPRSIVFIGASQHLFKWGFSVLHHIVSGGFEGEIYPVNPNGGSWYGRKVYKDLDEVPDNIDLAIIVVKKEIVLETIRRCAGKNIPVGIVITAGFSETGREGSIIEKEIVKIAGSGGMRLVGPNTMGVFSGYPTCMHAIMAGTHIRPGDVGLIAQSGNLGSSISYRFVRRGIGISRLISSGNEADLKLEDYLELLEHDPKTRLISLYVEGVRQGQRFFEAAKRISKKKPILVLKGGTTPSGADAAMSHTGAMAGDDAVFKAMCRQTGIIDADTMDEMVDTAGMLLTQPRPTGNKAGIVSLGGGWGVIATDMCVSSGLKIAPLGKEVVEKIDKILPSYWSRKNPIDLVAPNRVTQITDSIGILLEHGTIDAALVLGLGYMSLRAKKWLDSPVIPKSNAVESARLMSAEEMKLFDLIKAQSKKYNKPIIPVIDIMASDVAMDNDNNTLVNYLDRKGIMSYSAPGMAIRALAKVVDYYKRIEYL
ncbi:MAG: CoA-binding protein [Thermodesulfobacteriota bacterium]|nr:CoA-binding protein [Thermodesulfobacteriota bacterium]